MIGFCGINYINILNDMINGINVCVPHTDLILSTKRIFFIQFVYASVSFQLRDYLNVSNVMHHALKNVNVVICNTFFAYITRSPMQFPSKIKGLR